MASACSTLVNLFVFFNWSKQIFCFSVSDVNKYHSCIIEVTVKYRMIIIHTSLLHLSGHFSGTNKNSLVLIDSWLRQLGFYLIPLVLKDCVIKSFLRYSTNSPWWTSRYMMILYILYIYIYMMDRLSWYIMSNNNNIIFEKHFSSPTWRVASQQTSSR